MPTVLLGSRGSVRGVVGGGVCGNLWGATLAAHRSNVRTLARKVADYMCIRPTDEEAIKNFMAEVYRLWVQTVMANPFYLRDDSGTTKRDPKLQARLRTNLRSELPATYSKFEQGMMTFARKQHLLPKQ